MTKKTQQLSIKSPWIPLIWVAYLLVPTAFFIIFPIHQLLYEHLGLYYNQLRILQLLTFAMLTMTAWLLDLRLPITLSSRLFLAALVVGLLSCMHAGKITIGLQEVALTTLLALSTLAMLPALYDRNGRNTWLLLICLLPIIPSVLLLSEIPLRFPAVLWNQSFGNIRIFDDSMLPLIFLCAGIMIERGWKVFALLLPAIYLFGLLIDSSRSGLLSYIATIAILWVIPSRTAAHHALKVLLLAVTIFIIVLLTADNFDYSLIRTTSSGRVEIYIVSFANWQHNLWLGIGPGSFNHLAQGIPSSHPHNIIWQWLYEWGLLGGSLLFTSGCCLLSQLWQKRHQLDPWALAALIAFLCNSLFGGAMIYPGTQLMLILLMALLFGDIPSGTMQQGIRIYWPMLIALAVILIIQCQYIIELFQGITWHNLHIGPRFWAQGQHF